MKHAVVLVQPLLLAADLLTVRVVGLDVMTSVCRHTGEGYVDTPTLRGLLLRTPPMLGLWLSP